MKLPNFEPTSLIVSVSGGLDSDATAIAVRNRWPKAKIVLWHAYLAEMDWPQTDPHLDALATSLGNCERVTCQAVYALTGEKTPSGFNATTLRRIHRVDESGPARDDDPDALLTLPDFTLRARNGMPPTSQNRYCTSYFKSRAFDRWATENRRELGDRPILFTGERWAESPKRSKLPAWEWRTRIELQPTKNGPGWKMLWVRPVVDLRLHQVCKTVVDYGLQPHPGYFIQGETLDAMLNPERKETGRARLSCVCCVFTHAIHMATALQAEPALVGPYFRRMVGFENQSGYSWSQRGPLNELVQIASRKKESTPLLF